MYKTRRSYRE